MSKKNYKLTEEEYVKATDKYLYDVTKKKKPWWARVLLFPFKLLWWIIKKLLIILTLGLLSGAFDNNKK